MNVTFNECLDKMANLGLGGSEDLVSEEYPDLGSDSTSPMNDTAPFEYYESSDSDDVQSAPELDAAQRKSDNARLYPLEVKLYWTYEEVERGTTKKKRKRRVDVYNGNTGKRRKCNKERGLQAIVSEGKGQLKQEMGYEADDEN